MVMTFPGAELGWASICISQTKLGWKVDKGYKISSPLLFLFGPFITYRLNNLNSQSLSASRIWSQPFCMNKAEEAFPDKLINTHKATNLYLFCCFFKAHWITRKSPIYHSFLDLILTFLRDAKVEDTFLA